MDQTALHARETRGGMLDADRASRVDQTARYRRVLMEMRRVMQRISKERSEFKDEHEDWERDMSAGKVDTRLSHYQTKKE